MNLTAMRAAATAIAAAACPDVAVVDHLPDKIASPCIMFGWSDPMIEPDTFGDYTARLMFVPMVARRGLDPQLARLEDMISALCAAIQESADFTLPTVTPPRPFKLSGITYMAAFVMMQSHTGCDFTPEPEPEPLDADPDVDDEPGE